MMIIQRERKKIIDMDSLLIGEINNLVESSTTPMITPLYNVHYNFCETTLTNNLPLVPPPSRNAWENINNKELPKPPTYISKPN